MLPPAWEPSGSNLVDSYAILTISWILSIPKACEIYLDESSHAWGHEPTLSHHEAFMTPQYKPLLRVVFVAAAPSNSKKRYINFVTGVSVRSLHPFETPLQCSTIPLEPDIKAAVDETVREINEHEDLLGYIAPLDYLLPLCFSANSQKDAPANSVHAPAVPLWAHICFTVLIMFILK